MMRLGVFLLFVLGGRERRERNELQTPKPSVKTTISLAILRL